MTTATTMQRLNVSLPLCCLMTCCCSAAANELHHQSATSSFQRRGLQALHLPPAPVTPFRGGLSAVRSDTNNNSSHRSSDVKNNNDDINSENGDGSVEASSSDYHNNNRHHQQQSSSSLHHNNNRSNSVKTFSSSWTPEDFPDPWTNPLLCGGAATSSQLKNQQQQSQQQQQQQLNLTPQQQQSQMKRPLFCDPDQVLDKATLHTVMVKLREFSQEFASKNFVEGGDFGLWEMDSDDDGEDEEEDEDEEELQQQQQQQSDGIDEWNSSNEDDSRSDQTTHNLRRKRLQHQQLSTDQDNINPINNKHSNSRQLSSSSNNNKHHGLSETDTVEVAIALVQKINLPAILRADSYFFYSDQDDMVNDAAQYFARYVHDTWNKRVEQQQQQQDKESDGDATTNNIVLIFISVHDRICYISSGTRIATILPWWRLEHVVQDMKPMLRKGRTGDALEIAIDDMTTLLRAGSPTVKDRMDDFFSRFGVVLAFALFTFLMATYGEFQDRRKRVILAERRSRMNEGEREKARLLQKEFQTKVCPICLEPFIGASYESGKDDNLNVDANVQTSAKERVRKKEKKHRKVDSHGIPLKGNDDKPIKFLRCGHIFDETCWTMWVDSGHGNALMCPVCRQDIGRGKRGNRQRNDAGDAATRTNNNGGNSGQQQQQQSLFLRIMEHAHAATTPATLLRVNNLHTTPTTYGSTLWSSTRPDYEEGLNDATATSLYSEESAPLI